VVLHDHITRARAIGLACIVLGDLFVGGASLLKAFDGGEVWKGDLLFMSAAFCWACYTVLVRRHALDPVRATSTSHLVMETSTSASCFSENAGKPNDKRAPLMFSSAQ